MPKLLASMEVGAERITEIVRALQDFSHRGGAHLKQIDVHHGLDSTLTILGNRLKPQNRRPKISVERHYGQLPLVECYPGLLNQVFMNLFVNAIDAVDEKAASLQAIAADSPYDPRITISTYCNGGDRICIAIIDNGVGISEAVKRRMLDPFFTTKPVGRGTGLGMSISHQIVVERHRGS